MIRTIVSGNIYVSLPSVFVEQARHDFDVSSSLPTKGRVSVETFEGKPIDVELPSSVSGQHVVNMKLVVGTPSKDDGRGRDNRIRADMTLPVHLRYPDPGCERRGDGCDEYAWVEVSRSWNDIPSSMNSTRSFFVHGSRSASTL